MAAPAWRANGALLNATSGTVLAPASLATDEVEFMQIESQAGTHALTTANGFVSAAAQIDVPNATATIATHGSLWWRRYAGQADPVVAAPTNHAIAQRYVFTGCITTGDPWDFIQTSSEATEDTSGSATGNTTSGADRLIAVFVGASKPDSVGTAEISSPTNANLASVTERADNAGNSGNGGHIGLITGVLAAAGATGDTTYTKATSAYKWHFVVALKPPASGGISGTASITQAADGTSATGVLPLAGTATQTQAAHTVSAASTLKLAGVLSATQAGDSLTATATLSITGTLSLSQVGNTVASGGTLAITGIASLTQAGDTLTAEGILDTTIRGVAFITQAGDTVSAMAVLPISAIGTLTQEADGVSATAALSIVGTLAIVQAGDTLSATATLQGAQKFGALDVVQAGDTLAASGQLAIRGRLALTQAGDYTVFVSIVGRVEKRSGLVFSVSASDFCANVLQNISDTLINDISVADSVHFAVASDTEKIHHVEVSQ